jgi:UDP-N-acetylglucosamine 1-carboxyvinyltransferase
MAASLLTSETCRLRNAPQIADVDNMASILRALGARIEVEDDGRVKLRAAGAIASEVPEDRAQRMRASILLLGPLLGRTGRAVLPKPGGDDIGMRRVEQHVNGLVRMGARVGEEDGHLVLSTAERLHGAEIQLDMPTVTGTENLLMAASLARGRTTISNAAREPHVQDLATALIKMGARIRGVGTDRIEVLGVDELGGYSHRVIPDYIEGGTYAIIGAAAPGGDVTLTDCPVEDLEALILKLRDAGARITVTDDTLNVKRGKTLRHVDLTTWTHPGFATDLQPQFTALMTQARGTSIINEFLFENRFQHVAGLRALGAKLEIAAHGRSLKISGPTRLLGARVGIPDIRSGAALLIAALTAAGTTELAGIEHLDRGYEDLAGKLSRLGARVRETSVAG